MSAPKRPAARKPLPPPDPGPERQPAPASEADELAQERPAEPQPAEPVQRTCARCRARQPLPALDQVATWLQCRDYQACARRAATSGLYPMAESELSIASGKSRRAR